jgi:hypothetical protein
MYDPEEPSNTGMTDSEEPSNTDSVEPSNIEMSDSEEPSNIGKYTGNISKPPVDFIENYFSKVEKCFYSHYNPENENEELKVERCFHSHYNLESENEKSTCYSSSDFEDDECDRKCCCRLSLMPTILMISLDDNNSYMESTHLMVTLAVVTT